MSEQHDPIQEDDYGQLTSHNYDGIQEYDNPTPAWWTWVFVASVLFAAVYMLLVTMAAGGLSPEAEFERAKVANQQKKFAEIGTLEPTAENILHYVNDEAWLAYGQGVFRAKCATCHGGNAEGNSGPNLTDDAYLHIAKVEDIATVVRDGVVEKGMPAWGAQLHPNDVVMVSSYLASVRGTNAPGGKSAQGEVPPPWSAGGAAAPKPEVQE